MSKLNMAGGGAGATTSEFSRSAVPYFSFSHFNMDEISIVLFELLPKIFLILHLLIKILYFFLGAFLPLILLAQSPGL